MAELVLEAYDRFVVLYDMLALIDEKVTGESAPASAVHLPPGVVNELLSFMLAQGFVKTVRSDSELRVTGVLNSFA